MNDDLAIDTYAQLRSLTGNGELSILLLLAGSIVSSAMERAGAHRRVALGMVRLVGGAGGRRLVLDVMAGTRKAE